VDNAARPWDVRFTPKSGLQSACSVRPLIVPRRNHERTSSGLILIKVPIDPLCFKSCAIGATVIAAVLSASPISVKLSAEKNLSVSQDKAFAVVGRPATPRNVAGAHRRHERREHRRHTY